MAAEIRSGLRGVPDTMSPLATFIQLGFRHIIDVEATDHILFLPALAAIYRLRDARDAL
jgi:hypothetical protein